MTPWRGIRESAAIADRHPPQVRRLHRHPHGEWNLVLAGSIGYLIDDRPVDLAPLDVLWIPPGARHWLARAPTAVLLVAHTQHGPGPRLRLARCEAGAALEATLMAHLRPLDQQAVTAIAGRLMEAGPPPAEPPAMVRRALGRLDADPAGCRLADAARAAGVSAGHLSGAMRAGTGATFTGLRTARRLLLAAAHWRSGRDWRSAAAAAGFGCYMQFHRACHRATGRGPRRLVEALSREGTAGERTTAG